MENKNNSSQGNQYSDATYQFLHNKDTENKNNPNDSKDIPLINMTESIYVQETKDNSQNQQQTNINNSMNYNYPQGSQSQSQQYNPLSQHQNIQQQQQYSQQYQPPPQNPLDYQNNQHNYNNQYDIQQPLQYPAFNDQYGNNQQQQGQVQNDYRRYEQFEVYDDRHRHRDGSSSSSSSSLSGQFQGLQLDQNSKNIMIGLCALCLFIGFILLI